MLKGALAVALASSLAFFLSVEIVPRPSVASLILSYLGTPPSKCRAASVSLLGQPSAIETISLPFGSLKKMSATNCSGTLRFIVGIPSNAIPTSPVVLVLPQTGGYGASEVFGLTGNPDLAIGQKFMKAGLTVVSPEVFINGYGPDADANWNTAKFYQNHPNWSALGRMLLDNQSAIDILPRLGLKPHCIAAVGHSLGGHNSLFLAALDKRIDVVVSSGGFEPIATDEYAGRWTNQKKFEYVPLLRAVTSRPAPRAVPWDFDDVLQIISPRPVMIVQGDNDPIWTREDTIPSFLAPAMSSYEKAGRKNAFQFSMFHGAHEYPQSLQEKTVTFVSARCSEKF